MARMCKRDDWCGAACRHQVATVLIFFGLALLAALVWVAGFLRWQMAQRVAAALLLLFLVLCWALAVAATAGLKAGSDG